MPETSSEVLREATLRGFDEYIRRAEELMDETLGGSRPFLWSDASPEQARQVHRGQVVAQSWSSQGPAKVPHGLIHDWIGATRSAGATMNATLSLIQNYNNHKNIYQPEVIASKLISHHGNNFEIYLRLLKKKVITVVLDTDHHVEYRPSGRERWVCRSYSTRIAEVENPGKPAENVLPPDTGHGFLWRLYSYWRFQEGDDGVDFECRAISLTRDVPTGFGWIIEPIIEKLPKESLIHTLDCTRQALRAKAK